MPDNLEIAKKAIAAINAHDIDTYLQFIDDSYVAESEIYPAPVHGKGGARQSMQTMLQAFPDIHFEIEQMLASGDHVVSRVLVTGTHQGNFAGIPPTGRQVSWRMCNVVEIRDGRAIRNRIYGEYLSLVRQLGASKTTTA
jgi:steroid delta-isomerase-like uncharacterized protein